ncbi:MAG: hypothetical protein A2539_01235 [Elusimicrobia bacterium RIFOXYD2_FULL_34_15]|nr:MAG: hypothetical protein A2539_01235 [Elusimicrobia bacterium RIFOXYD2_FULL_34_15]
MKKSILITVLVGLISVCLVSSGDAKDTAKRIMEKGPSRTGIGFNNQLSNLGITSLSIRHWATRNTGFEGLIGFSLGDNTIFDIGAKLLMVLKKEDNLSVYSYGLAGIESFDVNSQNDTSLTLGAGFGIEFFLTGLSNLGFGTELGLSFSNANNRSQFGTSSGFISSVGIRYYL